MSSGWASAVMPHASLHASRTRGWTTLKAASAGRKRVGSRARARNTSWRQNGKESWHHVLMTEAPVTETSIRGPSECAAWSHRDEGGQVVEVRVPVDVVLHRLLQRLGTQVSRRHVTANLHLEARERQTSVAERRLRQTPATSPSSSVTYHRFTNHYPRRQWKAEQTASVFSIRYIATLRSSWYVIRSLWSLTTSTISAVNRVYDLYGSLCWPSLSGWVCGVYPQLSVRSLWAPVTRLDDGEHDLLIVVVVVAVHAKCVHRVQSVLWEQVVEARDQVLLSDALCDVIDGEWRAGTWQAAQGLHTRLAVAWGGAKGGGGVKILTRLRYAKHACRHKYIRA